MPGAQNPSLQGVPTPGEPADKPSTSMHDGVEVWDDDICSCAAEPRWQSIAEESSIAGQQSRRPETKINNPSSERVQ